MERVIFLLALRLVKQCVLLNRTSDRWVEVQRALEELSFSKDHEVISLSVPQKEGDC